MCHPSPPFDEATTMGSPSAGAETDFCVPFFVGNSLLLRCLYLFVFFIKKMRTPDFFCAVDIRCMQCLFLLCLFFCSCDARLRIWIRSAKVCKLLRWLLCLSACALALAATARLHGALRE
nr:hypothetical protein [Pandoravirus aubagnensis]